MLVPKSITSGDLGSQLSHLLKMPPATVDLYGRYLRADGLLSIKGHGRGAAHMTPRDAITWLVSLTIDHERGGDFVREVKRTLALPVHDAISIPENFADDLQITNAKTAGDALTALIADVFSPRLLALNLNETDAVTAIFDSNGESVAISAHDSRNGSVQSALWAYSRPGYETKRAARNVNRVVSVHGRVFLQLGRLLFEEPMVVLK